MRPVTSTIALVLTLLVTTIGCRDDAELPTGAAPTPSRIDAAAGSAVLAFWQLSAGLHTCGVTTDNKAYCWGANWNGQLGDGTTEERHNPVAVLSGLRFRQVSANFDHTCGITTDFEAYCWGNNSVGQLGDGTPVNRPSPVRVAGGLAFRQVSVGVFHTCGVSNTDRRAYCWGGNDQGALGDGTTTYRSTPVPVAGGRQFREVAAGNNHTCGITTSNEAFCWGGNHEGQLGDSSTSVLRRRPARVAGGRSFRQLSTQYNHTCALTTLNTAFCWGNGREGELGNGKAYLSFWPRQVAGGHSFRRVTAGFHHTCAETVSGGVYCWGENGGTLGDGSETQRLIPVEVGNGLTFSQVSAGGVHTCGKTPAAVGYCWGLNIDGRLGDGTTTIRSIPTPIAGAI